MNLIETVAGSVFNDGGRHVSLGTLCSGTDAPLMAAKGLMAGFVALGRTGLSVSHEFSCEIEAAKQRFISRNACPSGPIFQDVIQMALTENGEA